MDKLLYYFNKQAEFKLLLLPIVSAIILFSQLSCSKYPSHSHPIVIYGDTRTQHIEHQKIVKAISSVNPAAVFHTGDLVDNGLNPGHWIVFNKITSELIKSTEFYPALGNHEKNSQLFFNNFDLPNNERWYSVEINNIHCIVLDSNSDIGKNSKQYKWVKADLHNVNDKTEFIIALPLEEAHLSMAKEDRVPIVSYLSKFTISANCISKIII